MNFDGKTFDPALDSNRLEKQIGRVFEILKSGKWLSLSEVSKLVGAPESSVSARIRDLRKLKFGGYTIKRRRRDSGDLGTFEYRMFDIHPIENTQRFDGVGQMTFL